MQSLKNPSWLNASFVEEVLRNSEKGNSVRVLNFCASAATNTGDNYTSDVIKVTIEFVRDNQSRKSTEKKTVIIKIAAEDGIRKTLAENAHLFDVEISMMTNTLPKMNKLLKNDLSSRILYVREKNPVLIVMEDLGALGFCKPERGAGLDLAHCLVSMRRIAEFHASSVAACESDPKLKEIYNKGMFSDEFVPEVVKFFEDGTRSLGKFVSKMPELGPKYGELIEKYADQVFKKCVEAVECRKDSFNVINHGDFSIINVLFRYPKDDLIEEIFVDFQLSVYTSPAVDLNMFLNSSINDEVLQNSKEKLLEEYLRTLTDTMKRLDCKTKPPSMEELKRELKDRAALEVVCSFNLLPLMLVDQESARTFDEILQMDDSSENPMYKNKIFRKILLRRIPIFKEMGLLDLD